MRSRNATRGRAATCAAIRAATLRVLGPVLAAVIGLAGCGASDGGPIGTGLTASVVGNVVGATSAVAVSIDEVPGLVGRTDEGGNFELEGEFAGALTVRFTTGEVSLPAPVAVPAGSALALSDVEIDADGVEIQARLQLAFVGRAAEVDCAAGLLRVTDKSEAQRAFEVAIDEDTQVVRRDGRPVPCDRIAEDRRVVVEGLADPSGASRITASRITIGQDRPGPIEPAYTIPFTGTVVAIDCAERTLALGSDAGRTTVTLAATTAITRRGGGEIGCAEVEIGDRVTGLGVLRLAEPASVRADALVVSDERRPNVSLRFVGFVSAIDCTTGEVRLWYQKAITRIRLTAETELDPGLTCADLRPGDRVNGNGVVRDDRPGEIQATRLRLRSRR